MKLRCIKINPKLAHLFKDYFQVGKVCEDKRKASLYLNLAEVRDGVKGLNWCAVQKAGKLNLNLSNAAAVTFELLEGPRRLVVTEKKVDRVDDKRRYRRLCRQYGKLRFTEPGMFCFIAWRAMKDNARNHKR